MKKLIYKNFILLFLTGLLFSCGTGPALQEKTASDASVNVASGAVDVDVNSGFTLTFSVAANTASVNSSTFFVVPTIAASVSVESVSAKATIDTTICNPANALTGTITPSTSGSCVTTYTSNPDSPLGYETDYALCVTSGVSFCNPNVNGFFAGLMENFTTVAEGATYTVGGRVTGLSGEVILQNNAADDLTIDEDGDFTFSTAITDGAAYDVTVKTNPDGQTCTASTNSEIINGANITDVVVTCSNNAYTVGGTVSGLTDTVTLQNNTTDDKIITENGSFTFGTPVADGATFNVTVDSEPDDQNCVVTNGSGTATSNIEDVTVTCTTLTYSVGGTVTGLDTDSSLEVVLKNNGGDALTRDAEGEFTFSTELESGDAYAVTISTQPDGQTCHILNDSGSGTVGETDVDDIEAYCAYFAYVTNFNAGTVSVIDTTIGDTTPAVYGDPITVGTDPFGSAITPDGSHVYVSNQNGGTVSIINTATNTVVDTMTGFNQPYDLAITSDGSRLYIGNHEADEVCIYNIVAPEAPVEITRPIPAIPVAVGDGPTGLAVSPDDSYVYVPNYYSDQLMTIDTSTNTLEDTITIAGGLRMIAFAPDSSYAYLTRSVANLVTVLDISDISNPSVTTEVTVGLSPQGIVVTLDSGHIYVANENSDNVSVITAGTWTVATIPLAVDTSPSGVAITGDGIYVYTANLGNDTVSVIDTSDNSVFKSFSVGAQPKRIAIQRPNPNP